MTGLMIMLYIDANDKVLGRLASMIAKQLLNGESVHVVNAEKAVILGDESANVKLFQEKRSRGDPYHGPFYPKRPDLIFKRVVRGMLPYKIARGREALKRLKVFISVPEEIKDKEFTEIKGAENKGECKFITLEKLVVRA
jgi:large subunit ribosomal protein L13